MEELTPQKIVEELNKYIVGQDKAKKAVAIALRNRIRRQKLPNELKEEIIPKNIIMMGPTGIGKTEIARRLSQLADAPFLKVEATKFTEIGYVGKDVSSMVRELTEIAVNMLKTERMKEVEQQAVILVEERILNILLPHRSSTKNKNSEDKKILMESFQKTKKKLKDQLLSGKLNDKMIEIETENKYLPMLEVFSVPGLEDLDLPFQEIIGGMMPKKNKKKKLTIAEAREILKIEEAQKLIDMDKIITEAKKKVENSGIIFLDEIDKIVGGFKGAGPDVSREGVQRDLLPIIEGTSVPTKYGLVKTDHILFIGAGAFHSTKPSDLIPELQGRFPIRVELNSLNEKDFEQILTEPKNALIKQYIALLETEGIKIEFSQEAIKEIAKLSAKVNEQTENIGARRLHTIMEKLLEDISFNAPNIKKKKIIIDEQYVKQTLQDIVKDVDLSKFIL